MAPGHHSVYEYGHIFPLFLSLAAFVFLLANRNNLGSYRFYLYYLVCLIAFFISSLLYAASIIASHVALLHRIAGVIEIISIGAIVLAVRSDCLRDEL